MYRQQTELSNNIAQADIYEAILGSRCCCTTSIYIPYSPGAPSVLRPASPSSLSAPLLRVAGNGVELLEGDRTVCNV